MNPTLAHRLRSAVLLVVVAIGAGFILGMVATPADSVERTHDRHAVMLEVVAGDYAPSDGQGILTDQEWNALLAVYGAAEQGADGCVDHAARLIATGDYTGAMAPCLGEEDSPAVAVLLGIEP